MNDLLGLTPYGERLSEQSYTPMHLSEVVGGVHVVPSMDQRGSHGLDRFSELSHPFVPRNKPEVKVVRSVFVVEVVDVVDLELLSLDPTDSVQ